MALLHLHLHKTTSGSSENFDKELLKTEKKWDFKIKHHSAEDIKNWVAKHEIWTDAKQHDSILA